MHEEIYKTQRKFARMSSSLQVVIEMCGDLSHENEPRVHTVFTQCVYPDLTKFIIQINALSNQILIDSKINEPNWKGVARIQTVFSLFHWMLLNWQWMRTGGAERWVQQNLIWIFSIEYSRWMQILVNVSIGIASIGRWDLCAKTTAIWIGHSGV